MRVDLLRHGETQGGSGFRGRLDDPLTTSGWDQMWAALAGAGPWTRVVSSPLRRCAAFAHRLARARGLPLSLDARWRELDFGHWEGRTAAELLAEDPETLGTFWVTPLAVTPPGGEPVAQLQQRVLAAWNTLGRHGNGDAILVITHGGPIRILLCHLEGRPLEELLQFQVPHGALEGFHQDGRGRWRRASPSG